MTASPSSHRPTARAAVAPGAATASWHRIILLVACALALAAAAFAQTARAQNAPDSFADLAEELLPAVVNISTTQMVRDRGGLDMPQFPPGSPFEDFFRDFFDRRGDQPDAPPRRATSLGSGFIISPDGYVVTNYHVIEGADSISVILHDDTSLTAELVGMDDKTDLAVLRVEADRPLPSVGWGDSDVMRVGDWVLAIGNPFGLGGTVTAGIVSARARDIRAGPYDDFLQTDASINRGNSGGPMFNMAGEVIGVNTAIFSPSGGSVGIGFAIPSALAQNVVDQLIEFGRTRRGWIGVRIQSVTEDIADSLGLDRAQGALVASLTGGGPAEAAGIEPGDVILTFDGQRIGEMRRLPRLVADTRVGATVPIEVWRRGGLVELQITLGELEEAEERGLLSEGPITPPTAATEDLDELGLSLARLTDALRQEFGIGGEIAGVVITDVVPDSPAAEKGLRPGEVILEVGQEPVTAPGDVVDRVREAREAGRRSVLLLVSANGDIRFVALNIGD